MTTRRIASATPYRYADPEMTSNRTATAETSAPPASTVFLVPPRVDRLALGRQLIAPLVSDRQRDIAWAQRGVHPDIAELLPPEGREKIGIDQVRETIRLVQFSPLQADRRGCLVPRAEDLTGEASNALLKVLEEPTRGAVFALLVENASDLLPTILSRSRIHRIRPPSKSEAALRLEAAGYSNADAAALVRWADRPGELDALLAHRIDLAAERLRIAEALAHASAPEIVRAALSGVPMERRCAHEALLQRAARRDPGLLTVGVRALAAEERPAIILFLGDLLSTCADLLRSDRATALPLRWVERACAAVDRSHRALAAYAPPESVLLSLFLSLGGHE